MEFDKWVQDNIHYLQRITYNITKNADTDDLFQSVIEQMLQRREYYNSIDEKSRVYIFVRIVKNNYFSKTSRYYYENKKQSLLSEPFDESVFALPDDEPTHEPTLEFVYTELDKMGWFERDIFLLWIELGSLKAVSKKTKIPHNSVGRYINKTKKELKRRWNEQ